MLRLMNTIGDTVVLVGIGYTGLGSTTQVLYLPLIPPTLTYTLQGPCPVPCCVNMYTNRTGTW